MLLISYGMPRSASTFVWQLTYDLINYNHKQHKLKKHLQEHQRPNFIYNVNDEIDSIINAIPEDEYYLIKTHGEYNESFRKYEHEGKLKIICTIRNPYDLCVSWMDIHKKEQQDQDKRQGFVEADSLAKVLELVKRDIKTAEKWLAAEDPLVFRYGAIMGDHGQLIKSIVDHIGLEVYLYDKVYDFYQDKSNITEFNKGVKGRGNTLVDQLDPPAIEIFNAFINKYLRE